MGTFHDKITEKQAALIAEAKMFFVASTAHSHTAIGLKLVQLPSPKPCGRHQRRDLVHDRITLPRVYNWSV